MLKARVWFAAAIAIVLSPLALGQVEGSSTNLPPITNVDPVPDPLPGPMPDAGGKVEPAEGMAGKAICFGDGTWNKCPSGNMGMPGRGCENSEGTGGAMLSATGVPKLSKDSFRLAVTGMPSHTTVLYLQARKIQPEGGGVIFGDGILCLYGSSIVVGKKRANGVSMYPEAFDLPLCDAGRVPEFGATVHYQVLYRDEHDFGTKEHFNLSNAWTAVWMP